jgi:hypothetical protein
MITAAIVGVLGIWMVLAPFAPMSIDAKFFNDLLVGLVVTNLGVTMVHDRRWVRLVVAAVGIWICVSSFIPRLLMGSALTINDTTAGLLLVAVAGAAIHDARHSEAAPFDGTV